MKFVLVTIGSAGDVHPLIGLGRELMGRGHEVVAVLQAFVAPYAERAGIRTISVGNLEEQLKGLRHTDLWQPKLGYDLVIRWLPELAREAAPALAEEIQGPETVIISGVVAFAARALSEARGVPAITVHLHAASVMSVEKSPLREPGREWLLHMPKWVRWIYFSQVTRRLDRKLCQQVNQLRREVGVKGPEARRIMRDWWHSPDGVLFMFPEWYVERAADWPAESVVTRFPLYDEGEGQEIDPGVEAFLKAEPGEAGKPVAITPGSANVQGGTFLTEAMKAVAKLGRRALVISPKEGQMPAGGLPGGMMWAPYVPFSKLFPRCAGVIHHGGIGTLAFALAAGIPQLTMPMAHDQPDNAWHLKQWGVGDYVYPKHFRAAKIERVLGRLLGSAETQAACGRMRELMRQQMTMGEMAEIVEGMGRKGLERHAKKKGALVTARG